MNDKKHKENIERNVEPRNGEVTTFLNAREKPGIKEKTVFAAPLKPGTFIKVIGETKDSDGNVWLKIVYGGKQAFVDKRYVTVE